MKIGDLIWQSRIPGGVCTLIEVWDTWEEYQDGPTKTDQEFVTCWGKDDFPIFRILHPVEGLFEEPSYYYEEIS